jgi:group I intron endonuclease
MNIYKITNLINGKIYIGKDKSDNPSYMGSGLLIRRSIKKYGLKNFEKSILESLDDYVSLCEREKYWINLYDSTNPSIGYNISEGGDGGDVFKNHPHLDQIKKKISQSSYTKGKKYEECFGNERAKSIREKLSKNHGKWNKGIKKEKIRSNKRKINRNNLESSIINEINEINSDYSNFGMDYVYDRIRKIVCKIPNSIFKNRTDFYSQLNPIIMEEINGIFISEKINNGRIGSKKVTIDGVLYGSIKEASDKTGLSKKTIKKKYL